MHLEFGTAIHEALNNMYEQCDEKTKWEFADFSIVSKTFKNRFKQEHIDDAIHTPESHLEAYETMVNDGIKMLKAYWDRKEDLMASGFVPVKFEQMIKMPIEKDDIKWPIPISLRLDYTLEGDNIGEIKTSSAKYKEDETKLSPQALSYVFTQWIITGKIPKIHYVVLLKKKEKDRIQHFVLEYQLADLLAFNERVLVTFEKIKNREFERPSRGHMPFCECFRFDKLLNV